MKSTLGQRIAELRKARGMTQDELAERMGVSAQAVSKWENDISCPDIMVLPQLADFFGVSVDELLRGDAAPETRLVTEPEERDLNKVLLRVTVDSSDGDRVRVNCPFALVKAGLAIGLSSPEINGNEVLRGIDFNAIIQAVEKGVVGKLVEVDSKDGDHVEVWVE